MALFDIRTDGIRAPNLLCDQPVTQLVPLEHFHIRNHKIK